MNHEAGPFKFCSKSVLFYLTLKTHSWFPQGCFFHHPTYSAWGYRAGETANSTVHLFAVKIPKKLLLKGPYRDIPSIRQGSLEPFQIEPSLGATSHSTMTGR